MKYLDIPNITRSRHFSLFTDMIYSNSIMLPPQHILFLLLLDSISLVLLVDGQKINEAPRWKPKSRPFNRGSMTVAAVGLNVRLRCPAYGYPKPKITWYKDENLFDDSQRPKTKLRHFALSLNDVQTSDSGKYKCVVQNSEGSLEFTFILDVKEPPARPLMVKGQQNTTVMEGERVVFECLSLNDPHVSYQWMKWNTGGGDVGGSSKYNILGTGPGIVIENATSGDAGIYTCMVNNMVGMKSVNVWLKVRSATTISSSTTENTTTAQKPPPATPSERPTTRDPERTFSFSTEKDPNSSRQSHLNTKAENVQLQKKTVDILEELLSIQKRKLKLLQKSLTS